MSVHTLSSMRISTKVPSSASWNYLVFKYSWALVHWGLQRDQKCIFHRSGFEQEVVMTSSYIKKKLDFSQWPWAEKHEPIISTLNCDVTLYGFAYVDWFIYSFNLVQHSRGNHQFVINPSALLTFLLPVWVQQKAEVAVACLLFHSVGCWELAVSNSSAPRSGLERGGTTRELLGFVAMMTVST